ncbi:hypothetical protein [Nemorincola caseinilytica]
MQAKVIRILSVLCILLAVGYTSMAQKYRPFRANVDQDGWAIGMNIGATDLWGDVGTNSFVDHYTNSGYTSKLCFMGGMFGRYTFHPSFAIRFHVNYGVFYATDKWNEDGVKGKSLIEGNDYVQRYLRAQTARTSIAEGAALFEFYPRRFNVTGKAYRRGQPFIAAGLAVFHFTPYSTVADGNTFVKTYDLSLEGQGFGSGYPKKASRVQPAVPLCIGYRWDIGSRLNLGIEYMYRMTFTDQLDGVSGKYISQFEFEQNLSPADAQTAMAIADKTKYYNHALSNTPGTFRGNPDNNDSYSSLAITFAFKVPSRDRIWWTTKKFGSK